MLPAYAGMILRRLRPAAHLARAPRVCGDDPTFGDVRHGSVGVLPAYAGMIPRSLAMTGNAWSAPRVCGDDPK